MSSLASATFWRTFWRKCQGCPALPAKPLFSSAVGPAAHTHCSSEKPHPPGIIPPYQLLLPALCQTVPSKYCSASGLCSGLTSSSTAGCAMCGYSVVYSLFPECLNFLSYSAKNSKFSKATIKSLMTSLYPPSLPIAGL